MIRGTASWFTLTSVLSLKGRVCRIPCPVLGEGEGRLTNPFFFPSMEKEIEPIQVSWGSPNRHILQPILYSQAFQVSILSVFECV